jgi:hypothetical protein
VHPKKPQSKQKMLVELKTRGKELNLLLRQKIGEVDGDGNGVEGLDI